MASKQCRGSAPSVPGKVGGRGQNVHWVLELGAEQPGHKQVLVYIFMDVGPFRFFLVNSPVLWRT